MTINSSSILGTRFSPVERLTVLNTLSHAVLPHPPHPSHPSLPSPRSEPIAGPSGLPPVQEVPLVCSNKLFIKYTMVVVGMGSSGMYVTPIRVVIMANPSFSFY